MDMVKATLETRENKVFPSQQALPVETIHALCERGVRRDAVMFHGAGVESLLRLFDTGFFPCGNGHNVEFGMPYAAL